MSHRTWRHTKALLFGLCSNAVVIIKEVYNLRYIARKLGISILKQNVEITNK
jgi:hypothetical protein